MNDLKKQRIWVNWRRDPDRGKIPINCRTGGNAQSDNPQTWNTFQMAEAEKHKYSGTGLMFAGGVCGVDIDGTDGHTNENPLTAELLDLFKGTYIERSPSGSGYHVIFKCDLSQIPTVINKDGKRLFRKVSMNTARLTEGAISDQCGVLPCVVLAIVKNF